MSLVAWIVGLGVYMFVFWILSFLFWIWMFMDALKNRDMLWVGLFVVSFMTGFLHGILATLYYFIVYKKNKKRTEDNPAHEQLQDRQVEDQYHQPEDRYRQL